MKSPKDNQAEGIGEGPKTPPGTEPSASQTQLDFELEFFGSILAQQPEYVDVLRVHCNNLTAKGLYEQGLEADRRLVHLRPRDPLAHYNLACSYSLLRKTDAAFVALTASLELGYRDFEHLLHDPDLERVRTDRRFLRLLRRFLKKAKRPEQTR